MLAQFELTTRCNFTCFYCAGRDMTQAHMPLSRFEALLRAHIARYGVPTRISLQGEGEPTLHPDFFTMADLVRAVGSEPYTITNGTCRHPERFGKAFTEVGVSLDTLHVETATQIGRHGLRKVIRFIEALARHVRVTIHTVAGVAPDLDAVRSFCARRGYRHIVQPLQPKADYARRYADRSRPFERPGPFACSYAATDAMRFYALDGTEAPCAFIKDLGPYEGIEAVRGALGGDIPTVCRGCPHGMPHR